jgi:serine/threonine protein kinase
VQLYEVYEEKAHCYLVMELMRGGELFDRILDRKNFSEKDARECIRGVLTGLDYLHQKYVSIHGQGFNVIFLSPFLS